MATEATRHGTFGGILAPTLLALLGGILYLRAPVMAGAAGALGAVALVGVGLALAASTATCLAAILSNAREDAGSTLSAIRLSQGPGVATAIGLPVWLARALSAGVGALAFTEAWEWLAPGQPALLVAVAVLAVGAAAAWQARAWVEGAAPVVLVLAGIGLVSVLAGGSTVAGGALLAVDDWERLWPLAIAGTAGVLVAPDPVLATGEPRRTAPGMVALGIGAVAWFAALLWSSAAAPGPVLVATPAIAIDRAAVPFLALGGAVAVCAWAVAAGFADGARILRDLLAHRIPWLERPGASELVTLGTAALAVLALRSLDGVAGWLALALLLAYGIVCAVVAIELGLGLSSFRPVVRPWRPVPIVAAAGAALLALLVDPAGAVVLTAAVIGGSVWAYRGARRRELRSALVTAMAEWAARRASDDAAVRAWKPSMLVPLREAAELRPALDLLCDLAAPEGSIRVLGLGEAVGAEVDGLAASVTARGVSGAATRLAAPDGLDPVPLALQALTAALFRPNLLVLSLPHDPAGDAEVVARVAAARATNVGVLMLGVPPGVPVIAGRRTLTLWIRNVPGEWDPLDGYEGRNLDLTLLLGYRLADRWASDLRLVTVVGEPEQRPAAERFLAALVALARLPRRTQRQVIVGTFEQAVEDLSNADLDVFGMPAVPDLAKARRLVERARSTCLFVLDSDRESALA